MSALPHIFLTGFMGSGKTTLGKKLAQQTGVKFIDLDRYIEKKENKTILWIFKHEGEETFRTMEKNALLELTKSEEPTVIALGGGTVTFEDNLKLVKNNGLVVYIELSAEQLAERLKKSRQKRPLIKDFKDDGLLKTINLKLEERKAFYHQAHIIVNGFTLTSQILNQKIIDYKKQNNIH